MWLTLTTHLYIGCRCIQMDDKQNIETVLAESFWFRVFTACAIFVNVCFLSEIVLSEATLVEYTQIHTQYWDIYRMLPVIYFWNISSFVATVGLCPFFLSAVIQQHFFQFSHFYEFHCIVGLSVNLMNWSVRNGIFWLLCIFVCTSNCNKSKENYEKMSLKIDVDWWKINSMKECT